MLATIPATDLQLGPAQTSGPLTVHAIFAAQDARLEYRSFAQAAAEGFVVRELEGGASVNDLVAINPLDVPVLLYDGEEVIGAQQNRMLDTAVLVPAAGRLHVPVSCVEEGRWDGARHHEGFAPAPQAAYPSLRRMKAQQVTAAAAAGGAPRANQNAVWSAVGAMAERRGVETRTGAMADVFEHDRAWLGDIAAGIERADRQVGAIAIVGGRVSVLDLVSRSDVWAALHGPLVQGYALDAVDRVATQVVPHAVPPSAEVAAWTSRLLCGRQARRRAVGLGETVTFAARGAAGTGLVFEGELIQLSAFPADEGRARIGRPSRRRVA